MAKQKNSDNGDALIYRGKEVRRLLGLKESVIAQQRAVIDDQVVRINVLLNVLRNYAGVTSGLADDVKAFLSARYPAPGALPIEQPDTIDAVAGRLRDSLNGGPEPVAEDDRKSLSTGPVVDGVRLVGADPAAEEANVQAGHLVKQNAETMGLLDRPVLEAFCAGALLSFEGQQIGTRCTNGLHGMVGLAGICDDCLLPVIGAPGWLAFGLAGATGEDDERLDTAAVDEPAAAAVS